MMLCCCCCVGRDMHRRSTFAFASKIRTTNNSIVTGQTQLSGTRVVMRRSLITLMSRSEPVADGGATAELVVAVTSGRPPIHPPPLSWWCSWEDDTGGSPMVLLRLVKSIGLR
uniref:(northern house mosquito) hypothetical protein n=1 Tax=Culex pipiens TaxID=7175 RepID=A0A8D8DE17_CULPI